MHWDGINFHEVIDNEFIPYCVGRIDEEGLEQHAETIQSFEQDYLISRATQDGHVLVPKMAQVLGEIFVPVLCGFLGKFYSLDVRDYVQISRTIRMLAAGIDTEEKFESYEALDDI